MSLQRIMPKAPITCDIHNPFMEEHIGYEREEALQEANRCLQCRHEPCVKGCIANLPIPQFIKAIQEDRLEDAMALIESRGNLSRICGRVCFYEKQCEGSCVRGIRGEAVAIGWLERYVSDKQRSLTWLDVSKTNKEIAIVGSGPSGLACAKDLAKLGHSVTIFEANALGGGVLRYGIPYYRLPERVVEEEIQSVIHHGVVIRYNIEVGKDISMEALLEQYDAVYIATGVGTSHKLGIEKEDLPQVISANEFLKYLHDDSSHARADIENLIRGRRVRVIGGGKVAMDAARSAIRLKAKNVKILYRRSMEELPARPEEIHEAMIEGVKILTLLTPLRIVGNEEGVTHIICQQNELTDTVEEGRKTIIGTNQKVKLKADLIITAIGGAGATWLIGNSQQIDVTRQGYINVGLKQNTNHEKVFAGGDVVSGALTVVHAMKAGRQAAQAIHAYVSKEGE